MKKRFFGIAALTLLTCLWMVAGVHAFTLVTQEMIEEEVVTETDLIRTVDNFIVLFDSSSSANEMVPGENVTKIQATKMMLKERAQWLPELGYNAGLFNITSTGYDEVYPILPYDKDAFSAAIDKLPESGSGPTMLQPTLSSLRKPLAGLSGKTAVILFTDGNATVMRGPKKPLQIAQEIAKESDVCFYLISSATEAVNEQMVKSLASINACSRVVPLEVFLDNPHYLGGALFTVKTTAYARFTPVTKVVGIVGEDMLFDLNSSAIREAYKEKLTLLGEFLQTTPSAFVVAAGFADNSGDEEYNLWLSEKRVSGFKTYLMDNFNIDEDRIVTLWYGELNPVADNGTEEGRQLNRRVEVAVGGLE